jgi:D-alanyl-D-alanine dipeptidase
VEAQLDDLIDIPEYEKKTLKDGNIEITVGDVICVVTKATRMDIRYAEDRNKDGKPLDTQIHLLERIAVTDLKDIRTNTKVYVALLFAIGEIRDEKHVELKKF